MDMLILLIVIVGVIALYFTPSLIGRHKRNANAICMLNTFLGWTFIGWIIALIWAVSYEEKI